MAATPTGELSLSTLRPKGRLAPRLMFEGLWKVPSILGVVFAFVAAGGVAASVYFISREKRFEREGQTATGAVVSKDTYTTTTTTPRHRRQGRVRTTTHYRVYYTFPGPEGKSCRGSGDVSHRRWETLKPGDPVEVQYLVSDPGEHRLLESADGAIVWLVVLFPGLFGVTSIVLLIVAARRAVRVARLLARGTLTRGTVEKKTLRRNIRIGRRSPFAIAYRFDLPDGQSRTGVDTVADFALADRLEPGGPVAVVYLPDAPERSAVFRDNWMSYFEGAPA